MILRGNGFELRPMSGCKLEAAVMVYRRSEDLLSHRPAPKITAERVLQDVDRSHHSGGTLLAVFDRRDEMVGVVDIIPANYGGDPTSASIELLMITAPQRRGGLGARVLARLEEELRRDRSVRFLHASVQADHLMGVSFWRRHGFRPAGHARSLPDGASVYEMVKKLR